MRIACQTGPPQKRGFVRVKNATRERQLWIEDEASKIEDTNFIVQGMLSEHALRGGNLVTGQQQFSGRVAAELMIEALGK